MSEVLVLVDHVDGNVQKSTFELLAIAQQSGEPVAVFVGSDDQAQNAAASLGQYGATKVLVASDPALNEYLVAPKAELLAQLISERQPAGVLVSSTAEGKEIAGRTAIKSGSGVITDAVEVEADFTATQSVFAGAYTVTGKVTKGTPIVAVKPNSVSPVEAGAQAAVEAVNLSLIHI